MAKRSSAAKREKRPGKTTRTPKLGEQIKRLSGKAVKAFEGYRALTAAWKRMSTSDIRAMLAGSMDLVRDGLRIVIVRYGHPLVALISLRDAALLELLDAPENKQLKARLLRQLPKE